MKIQSKALAFLVVMGSIFTSALVHADDTTAPPTPAPDAPVPAPAPNAPASAFPRPAPEPADVAAPKAGKNGQINRRFLERHNDFLARGKAGPIGVLFLGDSITEGWTKAKDVWDSHYGTFDAANFGIGGDKTQHVLWRIENGELDGINPKVVVLLIGTNNIGYKAEEIVAADTKIVQEIHQKLPDTKVLLLGIFPRGANPDVQKMPREKIMAVNVELAKLEDGNKTRFLDFGDKFLTPDGKITPDMMPDALHPTAKGYAIWADTMQPLLNDMMK